MSVVIPTYQKNGSLYTCKHNKEVVSMKPLPWRKNVLLAGDVGYFHFDCPYVTPVDHTMTNLPPPGSGLYSFDVCMYGDVSNERCVASQIPPQWLEKLTHRIFYSWKSMSQWDVHFVTLWSNICLDPKVRWKHVEGDLQLPTIKNLEEYPEMCIHGSILYKDNRRIGRARRATVIVPKNMKGVVLHNYCALDVLSRYNLMIPSYGGFMGIQKINDSEHMLDCAYDVVLAYLNK
jgi:hypothetical protein